jgi:adenylate cyclase
MAKFASPEDEWRSYLAGTHPSIRLGRRTFRHIPSSPRCKVCYAPFGPPGGPLFRRLGFPPWEKNPNMCMHCISELADHPVVGAEAEISFLFADVRRSSDLARSMETLEFARLMHRFYSTASAVLLENDAILDKFVGDEVVGFFLPLVTGPNHSQAALRAGRQLLLATGHGGEAAPWVPLGASVNTGTAFVGMVSRGAGSEFTSFGDPINIAAHLAAQAGPGEILLTEPTADAAGLTTDGLEQRRLSLKGRDVTAVVLRVSRGASVPSPSP